VKSGRWYDHLLTIVVVAIFMAVVILRSYPVVIGLAYLWAIAGMVRIRQIERANDRAEQKILKVDHLAIEPSISDRLTPGWCRDCLKPSGVVWELTAFGDTGTAVIGTYGQCTDCGGHDIEATP